MILLKINSKFTQYNFFRTALKIFEIKFQIKRKTINITPCELTFKNYPI